MSKRLWARLALTSAVLIAGLLPAWPLWWLEALPHTHETIRYPLLGEAFAAALRDGVLYPRWLPEMNGGLGYPTFVYYQPAYFFAHFPFTLLSDDFVLRQALTVAALGVLGAFGMFLLARNWAQRGAALVACAVFQLAPYGFINLYERGDLSEWMAMQLMPWPLLFLYRLLEAGSGRRVLTAGAGLAVSLAVVCTSHPVSVMFAGPLVLGMGALVLLGQWRSSRCGTEAPCPARLLRRRALRVVAAVLAGMALCAPYWGSVATMKQYASTDVAVGGVFEASRNGLSAGALLSGAQAAAETPAFGGLSPVGGVFLALALAGVWMGRRHRWVLAAGGCYLICLVLMTRIAAPLWAVSPFSLLQFPWRLAGFAPLLQAVCVSGLWLGRMQQGMPKGVLAGMALGLALLASPWVREMPHALDVGGPVLQDDLQCLYLGMSSNPPGHYLSTLDVGEWLPASAERVTETAARGAEVPERCSGMLARAHAAVSALTGRERGAPLPQPRALVEAPADTGWAVTALEEHGAHRLRFMLSGPAAGWVTINQLYLPGWVVRLNGVEVSDALLRGQMLPDGRMAVAVPPGTHVLEAWYDGPPGGRLRGALMLMALLVAGGVLWTARGDVGAEPKR